MYNLDYMTTFRLHIQQTQQIFFFLQITYRRLVDVVHVGCSYTFCTNGVLAQRKEVLSGSGQSTGLDLAGFYS